MGVVIVGVFVYFRSKTACLLICRKNVKIRKFDHLIACNDYFAQFLVLKYAFPIKEVLLRNSRKETWTRVCISQNIGVYCSLLSQISCATNAAATAYM